MSWLTNQFIGYPCALPEHLREKKHNDWFIGKWIPRSWNARGPRCMRNSPGYLPWPPRLVEGVGVARWESIGADSIIEIPELADRHVLAADVYGHSFVAFERQKNRPNFNESFRLKINWDEVVTYDGVTFGPQQYSPSALQKFSTKGWMKLSPDYYSSWNILHRREIPGKETGEDTVIFYRKGARPDHLDTYYNLDKFVPGMAGLKWE